MRRGDRRKNINGVNEEKDLEQLCTRLAKTAKINMFHGVAKSIEQYERKR